MIPDYEQIAIEKMDTAGQDHEDQVRSIARAQVYAILALAQQQGRVAAELAAIGEKIESLTNQVFLFRIKEERP